MPNPGKPVSKPIGRGRPLKLLKPGQLIGSGTANALITFYNAFINGNIVSGISNELLISELSILWKIKTGSGSGSGSVRYRGEYTPDGTFTEFFPGAYTFGDIVRITPGNVNATTDGGDIIPGIYICVKDGPAATDLPNYPLSAGGETSFWQWLSTYPTSAQTCGGDGSLITVFVDQQHKPS